MNKTIGAQLIAFGLILSSLSLLVHHLNPELGRTHLITSLLGGALCSLWGVLAVLGNRQKVFAVLTLAAVVYVLLGQAIMKRSGGDAGDGSHRWAIFVIVLQLVLSLAMLMRVAYAGLVMGGPADPFTTEHSGGGKHK